jgi:RimJ/RimL family protein N-acetyltransferase
VASSVCETERLRLREWREADGDAFYSIMNTAPVMEHLGGVQTHAVWQAALGRLQRYQRDFGHTFWIVEDKASGEMLGFCGLKRVNCPGAGALTGEAEIGWRLRESAWGQGIAKEAAIATLDLAFGRFGYRQAFALTVPSNAASWGLMKRLGMQRREDLDFVDSRYGPDLNPCIIYGVEATAWATARPAT